MFTFLQYILQRVALITNRQKIQQAKQKKNKYQLKTSLCQNKKETKENN